MRIVSWAMCCLALMGAAFCLLGCGGGGGGDNSRAPTVSIEASRTQVAPGEDVTLTWTSTDAANVKGCTFGAYEVNGSMTVNPKATTTYSITVAGEGGKTAVDSVTVTVVGDTTPTISIEADKTQVRPGETVRLTWTSQNATSVRESTGFTAASVSGSATVTPQTTTTYVIMVVSLDGKTASDTVVVTVVPDPPPTVNIEADKEQVYQGEAVKLTWTSQNAVSVKESTGFSTANTSGSVTVNPTATTTYSITVLGQDGKTATDSVTVAIDSLVNIYGDSRLSSSDIMLNSDTYAEVKVFRATRSGSVEVLMQRNGEDPIIDAFITVLKGEAHTVEEILRIAGPNNEGVVGAYDDIAFPTNLNAKGYFQAAAGQLYTVVFTTYNRDFGTYSYSIREVEYRKSTPLSPLKGKGRRE